MEIFEILKTTNSIKSRAGQLEELRKHSDNMALRFMLQGAYDDRISSYLPEGAPPFEPFVATADKPPASLNFQEKVIFNFFKFTLGSKEPILKQERAFIELLESVDPEDADVLIRMKDKTIHEKYRRLTKALIKEFLAPWVPDFV